MTRKELAKLDAHRVRKNPTLFALFRKYLQEDAEKVFPNGKMPSGCFGCQYQKNFALWAKRFEQPTKQKEGVKTMSDETKTYELKNKHTRLYFSGKVLSSLSSDEDWIKWIKHPRTKELVEKRKSYFKKLPSALNKTEPVKEITETKEPVSEEISETNETVQEAVAEKPKRGRKKKS